jgi:hypothetical protein
MKIASIVLVGLAGVFVGATIAEVLHKASPDLIKGIGRSTKRTVRMIGEAFKDGYQNESGEERAKAEG